jgi:hypothetical protein
MEPSGWLLVLAALSVASCSSPDRSSRFTVQADAAEEPAPLPPNVPSLCARQSDDAVHRVFCTGGPIVVPSLNVLASALDLSPVALDEATFLAHSTALFGRLVSPINPRIVRMRATGIKTDETFIAFQRGVQAVEIASGLPPNFYLVTFEQACNTSPAGCLPGDLYTPRIESNWTSVNIRDAEDLKNTPFDCRQCHQRGLKAPILLMRELKSPWTHFFTLSDEGTTTTNLPEVQGYDLFNDFVSAKGNEDYGGFPANAQTDPMNLEGNVRAPQPLEFDGTTIAQERWPAALDGGGYPSTPQPSPTWYASYEAFKRGEQLALPYFAPRPTDPVKQAALTGMYASYQSGQLPAESLTDLSDIFPDDPQVRAEIGLQTEPGATPAQSLVQACGTCHNDILDQGISRARFNIALSRMSRAELDLAVQRLMEPSTSQYVMPPIVTRQLDDSGRKNLISYLQQDLRSSDDDALLDRAAQLGMAGGAATADAASPLAGADAPSE